jgi:iron complex outermembrane receptor protein
MTWTFRLLSFFLLAAPAAAQQGDSLRHFVLDDSVVVVAGRYASTLARETNSIAVIDGPAITRMADHSLLEALQWEVPSAFLAETRVGGFGVGTAGTGMISLRGMGGKPNTGVAVMIDGHPDFMGIFGHPLPDVYGMDDIARVDVLLGPASTIFGGHALGGVINIVSAPARRNALRASVEAGSWNSYTAALSATRVFGDHGLRLTLRHGASDGHVPQSDFRSTRLQAAWDWRASSAWTLSARARYAPSRYDDPTRAGDAAGLGTYADIRRGMGQLIAKNSGERLRGSSQVFFNGGSHAFYDGFESDDRSLGASTYQQYDVSHSFSVATGGEVLHYGGQANLDDVEHLLTTAGVYAVGMYSPVSFLHVRAGLRYQQHSLGLRDLAPHLGLSVTPLSGLRVYASMQSGFRHPTLRELYLFPSSNSSLEAERSRGYEAGVEYVFPRGSIRTALYRTDAEDMITTVPLPVPPPPVRFANALDETLRGAEAQLRYRLLPSLQVQLAWSTLDPGSLTAFNPSQQFKYMLQGGWGALSLSVAGQYVQGLFAGNNSTLPMPDYHLLDLTAGWRLSRVEIYIKGRNILDRRYAVLPGYAAPGAHFFAGVRYAMER